MSQEEDDEPMFINSRFDKRLDVMYGKRERFLEHLEESHAQIIKTKVSTILESALKYIEAFESIQATAESTISSVVFLVRMLFLWASVRITWCEVITSLTPWSQIPSSYLSVQLVAARMNRSGVRIL